MMRNLLLPVLLVASAAFSYAAQATCSISPLNLTANATLAAGASISSTGPGGVILKKQYRLSALTGSHAVLMPPCNKNGSTFIGRMSGEQTAEHVFIPDHGDFGIRATLLYEAHGHHKEWILPFRSSEEWPAEGIRLDELILKIELVNTGASSAGRPFTYQVPTFLQTSDNRMLIRLSVLIKPIAPECHLIVNTPVVTLPPLSRAHPDTHAEQNLDVLLKCNSDMLVSLTPSGQQFPGEADVFANIAENDPAQNIGIRLFYAGLPAKSGRALMMNSHGAITGGEKIPLSVRYGIMGRKITSGEVKGRITLNVDFL